MKRCYVCGLVKPPVEFYRNKSRRDGLTEDCKLCVRQRVKEYQTKNRKEIYARRKARGFESLHAWRKRNPEYGKNYRAANKDKIRKYLEQNRNRIREVQRVRTKMRRREDPAFRAVCQARNRVVVFLRDKPKSSRSLGCSFETFKQHIESLFKPGMSWDNYGEWHIDHYFPLTPAYKMGPDVFAKACHYKNLRPEWGLDNIAKNDAIPTEFSDVQKFLSSF